jgi:hypothetical protein
MRLLTPCSSLRGGLARLRLRQCVVRQRAILSQGYIDPFIARFWRAERAGSARPGEARCWTRRS